MEDTYSVATNNRFALFMADEDDSGDFDAQEGKTPQEEASPESKMPQPLDAKKQDKDKAAKTSSKEGKDKVQTPQAKKSPKEIAGKRKDAVPGN